MWPILLFVLTVGWFALPLLPALVEWRRRRDAAPLRIVQAHDVNVRHFAERFRELVAGELAGAGREGADDAEEARRTIREGDIGPLSAAELRDGATRTMLVATVPLSLPNDMRFEREIYGARSVSCGERSRIRAVLAEDELDIGGASTVLRWAHGRGVRVGEGCTLAGRVSAADELLVGPGCVFSRLNAPCVRFGFPLSEDGAAERGEGGVPSPRSDGPDPCERRIHAGDLEIAANSTWHGDLVVRGRLRVGSGAAIRGSLKSHGDLRLDEGVSVSGAVVSSRDAVIGGNCAIGGPVVAEGRVEIRTGAVLGLPECGTTVAAPVIRVAPGVVVFGSVWAREQGSVEAAELADAS